MTLSEDQKTGALEPGSTCRLEVKTTLDSACLGAEPSPRHAAPPARRSDTQVQQGAKWRNTCFPGAWGPVGKTRIGR